ncbi:MAG: YccF domain-containing protein [Microthrixaceae bacterium]
MIGNVLWFLLAGIWLALTYAIAGLLLCITIVGIPFGVQAFKLAGFTLWPFGKTVVRSSDGGCLEVGFNVAWLILFGWEIFLAHLGAGVLLCLTVVGIPFGIQAFKLSLLALWPFGRSIVPVDSLPPGAVVTHAVPTDPTAR